MKADFEIPGVPEAIGRYVDKLPAELDGAVNLAPFWQAKHGSLLLDIPHVGAFHVTSGTIIEVATVAGVDSAAVNTYLHGTVKAALLQQRGEIALHAACLLPPGREAAVAICGASATGKSTLAGELCGRGWKLMADDLTRVQCADFAPKVWSSDTCLNLWRDACEMLAIQTVGLPRIRKSVERFRVSVPSHEGVVPLSMVLDLRYRGTGLERVASAAERMLLLNRHVFRRRQIAALGMQEEHGKAVMLVGARCVAGLLYGSRTESVQSLADKVEEALLWIPR